MIPKKWINDRGQIDIVGLLVIIVLVILILILVKQV